MKILEKFSSITGLSLAGFKVYAGTLPRAFWMMSKKLERNFLLRLSYEAQGTVIHRIRVAHT
jgi:hypothetical protein